MVVFEDAAHAYGGFVAILTRACETVRIPYRGFGVKPIKEFITGSGNSSKQDLINAVRTRGHEPIDGKETDAIALALIAENPGDALSLFACPVQHELMPKMSPECIGELDLAYESGTLAYQNQTSFGKADTWNLKK
jgi:hypothetical protein